MVWRRIVVMPILCHPTLSSSLCIRHLCLPLWSLSLILGPSVTSLSLCVDSGQLHPHTTQKPLSSGFRRYTSCLWGFPGH